jgi:hypothetical protein
MTGQLIAVLTQRVSSPKDPPNPLVAEQLETALLLLRRPFAFAFAFAFASTFPPASTLAFALALALALALASALTLTFSFAPLFRRVVLSRELRRK